MSMSIWVWVVAAALPAAAAVGAETNGAVPYGVAKQAWGARYGNHRARVRVGRKAKAVWVHLPWRRRDRRPQTKAVWVVEAKTEQRIKNVVCVNVNREFGDVVLEAQRAGEYYVYYMPFTIRGRAFPTTVYNTPKAEALTGWLKDNGLTAAGLAAGKWRALPKAEVLEFQARRAFDRMDPMEVIATAAEVEGLLAKATRAGRSYVVFPEDRKFPIRMTDDLPARWIRRGAGEVFRGQARRNELYVFQIGVFGSGGTLEDVSVRFVDLGRPGGGKIPASAMRCFNTGGVDWLGRQFTKVVRVEKGKVQPLWIGVDVPADAAAGTYEGAVTVAPKGAPETKVPVALTVSAEALADRGDGDLWRLARLRWLDSTIGSEEEVVRPYTPMEAAGGTVKCLGREVRLSKTGLPEGIRTWGRELLAGPTAFVVRTAAGEVKWRGAELKVVKDTPASVEWRAGASGGGLTLACRAKMEFDGYANYQLTLEAKQAAALADCRLEIPIRRELATYMMGMGCKGGYRPAKWKWEWDAKKHQDSVWVGDVGGGVQCKLKGPNYRWPLVNIHYHRRPLLMPPGWYNGGKGGCGVEEVGQDRVVLRAFSGPRRLAAGQKVRFDFGLLITPVKALDLKAHCAQRYYHGGVPSVEKVARAGAKIINIHHGNALNPYINYPFLTAEKMAAYVKSAHERGLKVKLYYTIRELTNHVAELWALRSLGDEIYADGPGGGYAWLHEHLVDGYSPAWHHPFPDGDWCASISQTGLSRWHNYYLEGLNWLLRDLGIDGLYLDEIGYDREIMKRVRRVLDKARPGSLLDLHSWNHFNGRAGYANCLNLYMEHLPYLDSLWIGEGRNYNEGPDHWMVEVSGIPFGLFSEMLQGGGNPWRGMLYGMTSRLPWSGNPGPIWKLWDDFGIADAELLGYWSPDCPVRTGRKDVLATVYRKKGKALVVVASWAKGAVECRLKIDWASLGLDGRKARLRGPKIDGLQAERTFAPGDVVPVPPGRGWMLIVE